MIIDFTKDIKNPFGLKPCPFCGANAEMKVEPHIPASKGYDYTPRCTVTGCCGRSAKKYTNEKQAIYRWNRRSDEQERPKGRWIEMPCEVGGTVYVITECKHIPQKLDGSWETATGYYCPYELLDKCPHDTEGCTECQNVKAIFEDYVCEFIIHDNQIDIITEYCTVYDSIFLTKEEAEKALADMRESE